MEKTLVEFSFNGYQSLGLYGRFWDLDSPKAILLIVHGHGEHGGRYSDMAEYFSSHGIAVMSFDLRGHGLSEGKRGLITSWNEFSEDLNAAVIEFAQRYPTAPMFLFGHSLGGTIALDYILSADITPRGAIISAPALGTPGVSPLLLVISKLLSVLTPRLTISTSWDSDSMSRDPEECRKYGDDPLVHDKASMKLSTELTVVQKKIFSQAEKLQCPILLSYGGDDRIAPRNPIEEFFELAGGEDKTFEIFEDAYHELHNDIIKEDVYKLYCDWILDRI